jgi:hypothetical protein
MPNTRAITFLAALVAMIVAAPVAGAQERRLDTPDPRYGMTEIEDGYLRLDRETGEVSHCRRSGADWSCTVTPDERRALEQELAALREERQALRHENARLRAALRDVALSADRAARGADPAAAGAGRRDADGDGEDATAGRPPRDEAGRPPRDEAGRRPRDRDGDGDFTDEAKREIDHALDVTAYAVRRLFETFQDLEDELSPQ